MIVCSCAGVNDLEIKKLIEEGSQNEKTLMRKCGAGLDCGNCKPTIKEIMVDHFTESKTQ